MEPGNTVSWGRGTQSPEDKGGRRVRFCAASGFTPGVGGQGLGRAGAFSGACVRAQSLQLCPTLCKPPWTILCPWDSPGKNAGAGCHFLLQGIFLIQ